MSALLLYPVLNFSFMVSFAFQHLVPAMLVRKVVSLCFNLRLIPKSANLAFPIISITNRNFKLKKKKGFKCINHISLTPTNQDILGFDVSMEHFGLLIM